LSTKRQDILARIKTDIEAITDDSDNTVFKFVDITKIPPTSLDVVPFPSCFIYSDRETRLEDDRAVIGRENWEWYVILEVWALDKDMEELLEYLHEKLFSDYTLNSLASYCERMGVDFFTIEPTRRLESMVIPYRILYRHTQGDM